MVHIKRVELSHFKSFGGTTAVPLLPGFTVVSGPNGSGKSNILDALLFCLGLATSKGMRAERLPDLVNHNRSNGRSATQTSVSVTFDLSDSDAAEKAATQEWTVTRRLRVGKGGNYASTYYIDGEPCTASELHTQLNRLRIYPEGYNVVLQGDVTRIITMSSRERREIIDELAGVAEFDRKIEQTRQTLAGVKEREERCQIIAQELSKNRDRLADDRIKAEKYQKLKVQIEEKQKLEAVLIWRSLHDQQQQLQTQITAAENEQKELSGQLNLLATQIETTTAQLDELNRRVKALGEEEQLDLASQLATQKAKRQQLLKRQEELKTAKQQIIATIERHAREIAQNEQKLAELEPRKSQIETEITSLSEQRQEAKATLEESRAKAEAIAAASDIWVQQQASLTRQVGELQKTLNPLRTEQAQLTERSSQLQKNLQAQTTSLQSVEGTIATKEVEIDRLSEQVTVSQQQIQTLAQELVATEAECNLARDTQTRLLREQRDKQRQWDKLEATAQAQQEAQGTYATKVILHSDLPGVCGLVAQLGEVEPRYQTALETSAGGRLSHLVVEDDSIAAAGIELLKQKRAGRATFLPLNKIRSPQINETVMLRYARGFVDLAVNLVYCQPRYRKIFAYVFGSTVVFETLDHARPYLGKGRIVTLEGELLESSGAMSGGNRSVRSSIHFGTATAAESQEIESLKRRLAEIEQILQRNEDLITQQSAKAKELTAKLGEARQKGQKQQLNLEQLSKEIENLVAQKQDLQHQLEQNDHEIAQSQNQLQELATQIPLYEAQLQQQQQQLEALEASQTHSEWQQIQSQIKAQETALQQLEEALRQGKEKRKDWSIERQRTAEKIAQLHQRQEEATQQQSKFSFESSQLQTESLAIEEKIAQTEAALAQLTARLGETKQQRDRTETEMRSLQHQQQQKTWQQQKLQETQQQRHEALQKLSQEIEVHKNELPNPLPEIELTAASITAQLEQLQKELRSAQKRLGAMEPVNMLALEEYDRTQARLEELSAKLTTLEAERTELLLRVENFTTLRFRAFKEAFDAVNENFQSIFATLSDGDGYLQLDDPENPFNGGLNLVAHPKGKPVQRLSSMSGGEKSLTALGFIFSLQRYRPSPFYAFDEVDMFLDGANVERLAKMIKQQAQQAQFIVVSLRRPMIESSERTIGVTQARGAYTQVLGIKL